jgi:error-prone DNA polymerase
MSAYAELAVTTNFSFLRGASHPQEYVTQAAALGLKAIGIADRTPWLVSCGRIASGRTIRN